jgi:hypothetical protein
MKSQHCNILLHKLLAIIEQIVLESTSLLIHTCASWIFIEFPLALASDSFPFQTLLRPLYSYLLSRKLEPDNIKPGFSTTGNQKIMQEKLKGLLRVNQSKLNF